MELKYSSKYMEAFHGIGNSVYDILSSMQTLNDPNATPIAKADAQSTMAAAISNLPQSAAVLMDLSPAAKQLMAAAGLTTSFANLETSATQFLDVINKFNNNSASFNDLFMSAANLLGVGGGLAANMGQVIKNPKLAFMGSLIQTYANLLKELNKAAVNGVDPITGLKIPNIFEWLTSNEYRMQYAQYLRGQLDEWDSEWQKFLSKPIVDLISEAFKNNEITLLSEQPFFQAAKFYAPPPTDPFALDLDGDGIETVNVTSGILFDHNADGVKTGTGWIKGDDGLLVRDLNNNGTIDSGHELFGDQTILSNGQLAANGFAALRDIDTNSDGVIDSSDAAFSELKVWRDLNQDGISQTEELQTLADAGIASINLTSTAKNQWQNGNTIASTGTYTKTDGNTGATSDINLASNIANSEFTDTLEIPEELQNLPDMSGSGKVRDLLQAATLSPELAGLLTQYAADGYENCETRRRA